MQVKFEFAVGQRVTLEETGRPGIVRGCFIERDEVKSYDVEYSDKNGAIFSRWFRSADLKAV